jgi:hypothetical protein
MRDRAKRASRVLVTLWAIACVGGVRAGEEIVKLPSQGDAVLPYLLSHDPVREYKTVAILFNGGDGKVGLLSRGIPMPGANFLVRTRQLFVEQGVAAAVIDIPSDIGGMPDHFRTSRRHADDVATLLTDLNARFPGARVFLVGTSRGTVSAAFAGAALSDRIAGVVLSSSVFNASRGGGPGLAGFDYASIRAPLLLVHHAEDTCHVTPYHGAMALEKSYPLVTVRGGKEAKSAPCDAFSPHGFFGKEAETVRAIADWMFGRPFATAIE